MHSCHLQSTGVAKYDTDYSDLNGCHSGQEPSRDLIFLHDLDNKKLGFLKFSGADLWHIFGENRRFCQQRSKKVLLNFFSNRPFPIYFSQKVDSRCQK